MKTRLILSVLLLGILSSPTHCSEECKNTTRWLATGAITALTAVAWWTKTKIHSAQLVKQKELKDRNRELDTLDERVLPHVEKMLTRPQDIGFNTGNSICGTYSFPQEKIFKHIPTELRNNAVVLMQAFSKAIPKTRDEYNNQLIPDITHNITLTQSREQILTRRVLPALCFASALTLVHAINGQNK